MRRSEEPWSKRELPRRKEMGRAKWFVPYLLQREKTAVSEETAVKISVKTDAYFRPAVMMAI